jgi:hypothetical protein
VQLVTYMPDPRPSFSPGAYAETRNSLEILPISRRQGSERGIGLRAATRCFAMLCDGPRVARCHAVEFSPSGVVIDRGRPLSDRERSKSLKLMLFLPGKPQVIVRALVKVARQVTATRYALKFVMISDVDRLTLMEQVDRECTDSLQLLSEIEGAA